MTQTIEPAAAPAASVRRARRWPHRLVPVVSIMLGIIILMYPVGATYYNDYAQFRFGQRYEDNVKSTPQNALTKDLEHARAYNAALSPTALQDPWTGRAPGHEATYNAYLDQLSLFDVMARVRVPSVGINLPVYHGTSEDVLAKGIGHLFGSSLPVGGVGSHAVLTGHSAYPDATLFDRLPEAVVGDSIYIDVDGQTLAYQVDHTSVVLPDELTQLSRQSGVDAVTLVTCTPRGINSHRLLVHAVRVPYHPQADPKAQQTHMDWSLQSWMYPRVLASALAALLLLAMIVGWVTGDRRRAKRQSARPSGAIR